MRCRLGVGKWGERLGHRALRACAVILGIAFSFACGAQAPRTIGYQGYLTTTGGVPVSATVAMAFSLYDVPSGGAPLWTEMRPVEVNNGSYSVQLGEFAPLSLPFDRPYYLGVTVEGDAEMAPRQRMAAAPYVLASCRPGDMVSCYEGAPGTMGVGPCKAGVRTCNSQGTFGSCEGQVTENCGTPTCTIGVPLTCGVGQCFRSVQCTTGYETCTPGAAGTEACNGVDDDCNGVVDSDAFPNLGNSCSVGVGACQATGVFVCSANQLGTQCSATPGPGGAEVCNGIDDDCDGVVDEGSLCSAPNANSACISGSCWVTSCQPGFSDCDGNPANGCETAAASCN